LTDRSFQPLLGDHVHVDEGHAKCIGKDVTNRDVASLYGADENLEIRRKLRFPILTLL